MVSKIIALTTSELLLLREWLANWAYSTSLDKKYVDQAKKRLRDVDKELWFRIESTDTPWGPVDTFIEEMDDNFEDTLKEVFKKEE